MKVVELLPEECEALEETAAFLFNQYRGVSNNEYVQDVTYYTSMIPRRIFNELMNFKYSEEHFGVCILRGYEINQKEAGLTPESSCSGKTLKEDFLFLLFNSLLGDVIGWSSQRGGAIINDILPERGNEREQLSTGSVALLEWHTEEAFHPYSPDNLSLFCIRNDDGVPTTFTSVTQLHIPQLIKEILLQPRFVFVTDKNFKSERWRNLPPKSILFGEPQSPYLRIDPAFMHAVNNDREAEQALDFIKHLINKNALHMTLKSGDFCFIDNYRVVHGRLPFQPRYDGTDRWLRRVNVTRDLRKSRDSRAYDRSRVIVTD